jgi:hypothetical protein
MGGRFYLEISGGVLLIIFGFLFLAFLPITISELATDAIFIGAGILIIRKAFIDRRLAKIQEQVAKKKQSKNSDPKTGQKKLRS